MTLLTWTDLVRTHHLESVPALFSSSENLSYDDCARMRKGSIQRCAWRTSAETLVKLTETAANANAKPLHTLSSIASSKASCGSNSQRCLRHPPSLKRKVPESKAWSVGHVCVTSKTSDLVWLLQSPNADNERFCHARSVLLSVCLWEMCVRRTLIKDWNESLNWTDGTYQSQTGTRTTRGLQFSSVRSASGLTCPDRSSLRLVCVMTNQCHLLTPLQLSLSSVQRLK